jgi:hypothetical protein
MERSEIDTQLVLVSARKSRVGDHWDKDDYDVRLGDASGPVVGRIMRHPQAPEEQPWFWTITAREQSPSVLIAATQQVANRRCDILMRGTLDLHLLLSHLVMQSAYTDPVIRLLVETCLRTS